MIRKVLTEKNGAVAVERAVGNATAIENLRR
jgi:hypothetical protein